jgi:UDP-N-acetylmuramyl tripeptide synthase
MEATLPETEAPPGSTGRLEDTGSFPDPTRATPGCGTSAHRRHQRTGPAPRQTSRGAVATASGAAARHPLERLDLCRIPRQGRVSAATAALLHGLLVQAGRRPALLTPEGGRIADRLFPQRPMRDEAPEWARLLATHVRWGGDCLVVEEDAEIEALIQEARPRARVESTATGRVRLEAQALHWRGTRLRVLGLPGTPERTAHLPLVGTSNLRGLEAALDLALAAGCPVPRALGALPLLEPPPGLLEPVPAGQPFAVFIDRASSATELAALLSEVRALGGRKIRLVAGIRGTSGASDRMALGAAARAADEVVFTSDNPGHVPAAGILADLQLGFGGGALEEPDRHEAIRAAIRGARADDVVLIAGKGALSFQEVRGSVVPWDDRLHARDALASRGWVGDSL